MLSFSARRAPSSTVTSAPAVLDSRSLSLSNSFSAAVPREPAAPLQREMRVFSFLAGNVRKELHDPLVLFWTFNPESRLVEIKGEGPYEDVMVHGDTLDRAVETLEREVIPCLWEDYANEDDARLSRRARALKADFLSRVAP